MTSTENTEIKQPTQISIDDFSRLIANMSRLLSGLAHIRPFNEAKLGLAEWVTLSMLAQKDGVSNKTLGRNLGLAGPRVSQINAALTAAGLVTVNETAANEIKITEAGRVQVAALNSQLELLLSGALKGKERSITTASKHAKILMRILHADGPDVTDKKGKKAKKAEARQRAKEVAAKR